MKSVLDLVVERITDNLDHMYPDGLDNTHIRCRGIYYIMEQRYRFYLETGAGDNDHRHTLMVEEADLEEELFSGALDIRLRGFVTGYLEYMLHIKEQGRTL